MFTYANLPTIVKIQIAYTCWDIWKRRCALGRKDLDIMGIIRRIQNVVMELSEACTAEKNNRKHKSEASVNTSNWQPPEVGWIKLNRNGACNLKLGRVVARDEKGFFLTGEGQHVLTTYSE